MLREIHGAGALETLESLKVNLCPSITTLGDLSKLQKLAELKIEHCEELQGFEGFDELGCLRLFEVIQCRSFEYWTNALDTMVPDECQVVIQSCKKLGTIPEDGMLYKDYRDMFLARIKSDSDAATSYNKGKQVDGDEDDDMPEIVDMPLREDSDYEEEKQEQDDGDGDRDPPKVVDTLLKEDSVVKEEIEEVAETEEKRQVASIEKDVGTDDQVNRIMSLMNINDMEQRIVVVIYGKDGIGKTTLAKLIYNRVFCDFDGCSFLTDIKEKTQALGGLRLLRTKLISDILKRELEDVALVNRGNEFFRDLFCDTRVLIVLDDVENVFDVQQLIGNCFNCFASGSRILAACIYTNFFLTWQMVCSW
ncbi:uncharacterized protein LOC104445180 [Eucalyptus grandis]|uniref:uncharacterized protein LOC104445180 n=1 Tax=Eucalyptus grandis TaxID=71139 RepID=UPI00192EB69B|nr:uncharacterized protein LOC104445180 [Eucalyptus grandis]